MFENIERIQIIAIIGSLAFLAMVAKLITARMLKEAYAILWLIFAGIFLLFSCWKKGLDYLAELFGIYYPPALLFLFLIVALIFVLVQFSVVISSQNEKIKTLCQELALLKHETSTKKHDNQC